MALSASAFQALLAASAAHLPVRIYDLVIEFVDVLLELVVIELYELSLLTNALACAIFGLALVDNQILALDAVVRSGVAVVAR